jgi:hypothetical protein
MVMKKIQKKSLKTWESRLRIFTPVDFPGGSGAGEEYWNVVRGAPLGNGMIFDSNYRGK